MALVPTNLIAVSDEVPTIEVPFAEIRSPRYGAPVTGYAVNSRMLGVFTHYYGGRTIPHLTDRAQCEGCQAERAKRWKGYFSLWQYSTKTLILAEITHFAAAGWKDILEDPAQDLRGAYFTLTRLGRACNSRVKLEINFKAQRVEGLPEPFSMLEVLRKIWAGEMHARRQDRPGPAIGAEIPR